MKIQLFRFSLLVLIALVTGCAVGNKYDYQLQKLPLPVSGNSAIGVSVTDSRPYVLSGDKKPDFVGLQRGGFGNPFNVTTKSGNALVDDMKETLARGLSARGFEVSELNVSVDAPGGLAVVAKRDGLDRVIVLDVLEWKSDAMMKLTLHYNLHLSVFDSSGNLLAEASVSQVGAVGGAQFQSGNSATVTREFERLIGEIFGRPEIKQALGT